MIRFKDFLKASGKKTAADLTYEELVDFFEANQENCFGAYYDAQNLSRRLRDKHITRAEYDSAVEVLREAAVKEVEFCECLVESENDPNLADDYWAYYLGKESIFS